MAETVTIETIRSYLSTYLDERRGQAATSDSHMIPRVYDTAKGMIEGVTLAEGREEADLRESSLELIWENFLEIFYREHLDLYHEVIDAEVSSNNLQIEGNRDIQVVVRLANINFDLKSGRLFRSAKEARLLLMSLDDIRKVLEDYYIEPPKEQEKFLQQVLEIIESGKLQIDGSFVLLKQMGKKRFIFGGKISDGKITMLGYNDIRAPCREHFFDVALEEETLVDLGEGFYLLKVTDKFENYPNRWKNPYSLPPQLFLLKSCRLTNWEALDLTHSIFAQLLQEQLNK